MLCFAAGLYSLDQFLRSVILATPIALFFAWMVGNIYIVLLGTLTKNLLPHIKNTKALVVSTAIRILFLILIAVIISKPIEAFLFSPLTEQGIDQKREALLINFKVSLVKYYGSYNAEAQSQYEKAEKIVEHSNFFIERIKQTNSIPFAWFITALTVFLFLLPASLKFYLAESSSYYIKKSQYEKNLIVSEYEAFKNEYKLLLLEKTGKVIEFRERFKNPPFNTKPLQDNKSYSTEADLIDMIYNSGN
jgi:hypothetical protein